MTTHDAIIIGGGHNGLIAAFYLAKAGRKPLVLEQNAHIGGVATTSEFHPGFRVSTLAHAAGPISSAILRDMQLERFGLRWLSAGPAGLAFSGKQLVASPAVAPPTGPQESLARIASAMGHLLGEAPPQLDHIALGDAWKLFQNSRPLRKLPKQDFYRMLRWAAMPIADIADEFFPAGDSENAEPLRAQLAWRALFGTSLGPRAPGAGVLLLLRAAVEAAGGSQSLAAANWGGPLCYPAGGMGALSEALASAAASVGAVVRTNAEVARIQVHDGAACGVVLASGEGLAAKTIVSNADPRRTFMQLAGPEHFGPEFVGRVQNLRAQGSLAKMNLALDALPEAAALTGASSLPAHILIAPSLTYIERAADAAKYGSFSGEPVLEVLVPSLNDPSLAPPGQHVISVWMQYAPRRLRDGSWQAQEQPLGDAIVQTLERYLPGLQQKIVAAQLITPEQMEHDGSLAGGHLFHAELAMDQLFSMRPLMECAGYRTPLRGLYLCGSGTHPGVALSGHSGANAARAVLSAGAP